ncbi:MAG: LptF/LptG family permease [Planctomycetota bacterium]
MPTTFDRHLFARYLQVAAILLVTLLGLVVVIDLLDNIDDFTMRAGDRGAAYLAFKIAEYYGTYSLLIFERVGGAVAMLAAMIVLWMLQRQQELSVLLAAGVPAARLVLPVFAGVAVVGLLIGLDQEFVIPRIAALLQRQKGSDAPTEHRCDSTPDFSTGITIFGKRLVLETETVLQAEFVLPPDVAGTTTTLTAPAAQFLPEEGGRPAGWRLETPHPKPDELTLTEYGRSLVKRVGGTDDLFVLSRVNCDQLFKSGSGFTKRSTVALLDRIESGTAAENDTRRMRAYVHRRLTNVPALLAATGLVVPLMLRKESRDAPLAFLRSAAAVGVAFGVLFGASLLADAAVLSAESAAWLPIVAAASAAAWFFRDIAT